MSEPASTIVFFDVDGVINADERGLWEAQTWRSANIYLESLGMATTVRWSTGVVDALRETQRAPGVEMVWLTTWTWRAPEYLATVIGTGSAWRYVDQEEAAAGVAGGHVDLDWWKADAVRAAIAAGHRVAWLDDDIDSWVRRQAVLRRPDRLAWMDPERLYTLCPASRVGLQWNELDDLLNWVLHGEGPRCS